MQNSQVDIYAEVHKGLRRELGIWLGRMGSLDAENSQEIAKANLAFTVLSTMLTTHANHEERWIHPLLIVCAPELVSDLEREHRQLERLFDAVVDAFDQLKNGNHDAPWAFQQILYRKFASFCGHYIVHMGREEDEAMPALQKAHSDQELLVLSAEIRGSTPPQEMGIFLTAMIPAMNLEERVRMAGGMKANAPKEAFEGFCALTSEVLNKDDWAAICKRVSI